MLTGLVVGAVLVAVPSCTANPPCVGFALSIASGARGEPTPEAALRRYLAADTLTAGFPRTGWRQARSTRDEVVFRSGRATLTADRVDKGWFITEGSTC